MTGQWPRRSAAILFAGSMIAAAGVTVYGLFVDRTATFAVEGRRLYGIDEFAAGVPVRYAFLMLGEGLRSVRVRLDTDVPATARVRWILWRGTPDDISTFTPAVEDEESVDVRPGGRWLTLNVPRDRTSHDRWYTIELRLIEPLRADAEVRRPLLSAAPADWHNYAAAGVTIAVLAIVAGAVIGTYQRRIVFSL